MGESPLELQLAQQIRDAGLPEPAQQYHFARDIVGHGRGIRKRLAAAGLKDWRWDFSWSGAGNGGGKVAVEVQGATHARGKHTRGLGYEDDCAKLNAGQLDGWRVFWFTAGMLDRDEAIPVLKQALKGETAE